MLKTKPILLFGSGCLTGFLIAMAVMASGAMDPKVPSIAGWGRFSGTPQIRLEDNGRDATVLSDFRYEDPRAKIWLATKDSKVDGASIPRPVWTIAGGPWDGKYRNASILHDVACEERTESADMVHLMFYEACRCGGLPEKQAKIFFAAVNRFGPRWDFHVATETGTMHIVSSNPHPAPGVPVTINVLVRRDFNPTQMSDADLAQIRKYVEENDPSIDDLTRQFPFEGKAAKEVTVREWR
jgi:Protein of unknown function (DUF1353)